MFYEYLLDLNAYFNDENGHLSFIGESVTCWGEDEYDALVRQINDHRRRNRKYPINIYYRLSRLRPTGRYMEYRPRSGVDFFNTNARPYINSLITRFMVRFLVSDTIAEIDGYKGQFDNYLEKYKDEFDDEIIQRMLEHYNKQRNKILSGEVKPLSPNYDLSDGNFHKSSINHHAEHTISLMKMFGFRTGHGGDCDQFEPTYEVLKPIYYDDNYFKGIRNDYMTFRPFELIIYWRKEYMNCVNPDDNDIYNLKATPEAIIKYIGSANDDDTLFVVKDSLKKFNIKCYYQVNNIKEYPIWVFYTDFDLVEKVINFIRNSLSNFSYNEEM